MDALRKEEIYTIDDIYALPDGERAELIDGKIYYIVPPSRTHQRISWKLHQTIANYIEPDIFGEDVPSGIYEGFTVKVE